MDPLLDPSTLGSAGVGIGAIFVSLVYKFLKTLVAFLESGQELITELKGATEALSGHLDMAASHAQREEELLEGILYVIARDGAGNNAMPALTLKA